MSFKIEELEDTFDKVKNYANELKDKVEKIKIETKDKIKEADSLLNDANNIEVKFKQLQDEIYEKKEEFEKTKNKLDDAENEVNNLEKSNKQIDDNLSQVWYFFSSRFNRIFFVLAIELIFRLFFKSKSNLENAFSILNSIKIDHINVNGDNGNIDIDSIQIKTQGSSKLLEDVLRVFFILIKI